MPVYFYNGVPLIRDGAVAIDEACCCRLCDCPCCPDEDFGGFRITIVAAEPAGGFAQPCCEDVGGVYDALITEENPTACEGRTFVTLGCGTLEVSWNIGCGGEFKTLGVVVILRSDLGEAEAQVNNQVALNDPCADLNFTDLQDTLIFPGVGDCAELTISAEALPCGVGGNPPVDPLAFVDPTGVPYESPGGDNYLAPNTAGISVQHPRPAPVAKPANPKRELRPKRKRALRAKRLPIVQCKHQGEVLGRAGCSCGHKPDVFHCQLLNAPCVQLSPSKPIVKLQGGQRIDRPHVCKLCEHYEAGTQ